MIFCIFPGRGEEYDKNTITTKRYYSEIDVPFIPAARANNTLCRHSFLTLAQTRPVRTCARIIAYTAREEGNPSAETKRGFMVLIAGVASTHTQTDREETHTTGNRFPTNRPK